MNSKHEISDCGYSLESIDMEAGKFLAPLPTHSNLFYVTDILLRWRSLALRPQDLK